ncbi:hypothetical protein ACIQMP_07515 [Streptomyces sp. NPDC091385]|uniref:hypothetical protein n=1 Tax=Streptomyces sp. NPDC091385 TaxID=3365997 RepID=UPI00381E19B1
MPYAHDYQLIAWLARAAQNPEEARAQMIDTGMALVQLGSAFAAVRMPGRIVHSALDTRNPSRVRDLLEERLGGSVILDARYASDLRYYALIPGCAASSWTLGGVAPCLGEGIYLSIPAPFRLAPPGAYWLLRPRFEGDVCRAAALQELLDQGLARLQNCKLLR